MSWAKTPPRIASVGNYVIDTILRLDSLAPEAGELSLVHEKRVAGGGAGFTTAVALARLGARAVSVGAVGEDADGDLIRRLLAAESNLDDRLTTVPSATSSTVCLVDQTGERSYLHHLGASGHVNVAPLMGEVARLDAVHFGGFFIVPGLDDGSGLELARHAHEEGVLTSLDTSWDSTGRWERVRPYLPFLDVFSPSLVEARMVTGEDSPEQIARWVREHGTRVAVITDGARGAYVSSDDYEGWVKPPTVTPVDTTGAGESFNAGLLFGLVTELGVRQAVALACAVGALATLDLGALGRLTSLDDALGLLSLDQ